MISSTMRVQLGLELASESSLVFALGVDVDERFVGIGQNLRPAAFVEHLDPVCQVELRGRATARVRTRMTSPLHRPRARQLAVDERARRAAPPTSSESGRPIGASSSSSLHRLATAS